MIKSIDKEKNGDAEKKRKRNLDIAIVGLSMDGSLISLQYTIKNNFDSKLF